MNLLLLGVAFSTLSSCSGQRSRDHDNMIGMDSFALAARYGTPATSQHQGEYLQLKYGSAAAGCQVIVRVDQMQRVVGWASSGPRCNGPGQDGHAQPDLNVLNQCPVNRFVLIPFQNQSIGIQTLHHRLKKRLTHVNRPDIV